MDIENCEAAVENYDAILFLISLTIKFTIIIHNYVLEFIHLLDWI